MYDSPGSLQGKLQAIWKQSKNSLRKIEEEKAENLKKAYRKLGIILKDGNNLREPFINGYFSEENSKNINDAIFSSYAGLLTMALKIKTLYYKISHPHEKYPDPFSEGFYIQLFSKDNFLNFKFVDQVIPEFFPLQLHSYNLLKILILKKGVPHNEQVRTERASRGASFRHFGKEILRDDVLKYISGLPKTKKYKSIKDFFKEHKGKLDLILREYQNGLGSPREKGGPPLSFGENMVADDFPEYIKEWNEEKGFKEALNELLNPDVTN